MEANPVFIPDNFHCDTKSDPSLTSFLFSTCLDILCLKKKSIKNSNLVPRTFPFALGVEGKGPGNEVASAVKNLRYLCFKIFNTTSEVIKGKINLLWLGWSFTQCVWCIRLLFLSRKAALTGLPIEIIQGSETPVVCTLVLIVRSFTLRKAS